MKKHIARKIISLVSAAALALSTAVPAVASEGAAGVSTLAVEEDGTRLGSSDCLPLPSSSQASAVSASTLLQYSAKKGTDLNTAWLAQEGGTGKELSLKSGGVYRLSSDLSVTAPLVVDAPGKDVVIDLGENVLSIWTSGSVIPVELRAAKSVTIIGAFASVGEAQLSYNAETCPKVIQSSVEQLAMCNVGMSAALTDKATMLKKLGMACVRVESGTVLLDGCSLCLDLSSQKRTTFNIDKITGTPVVVEVADGAGAVSLSNCSLKVTGSPYVELLEPETDDDPAEVGHVYAVSSSSPKGVALKDCSIEVTSKRGVACGVHAAKAILSGNVDMQLEGYQGAYGVWSAGKGSAELNAQLSVRRASEDGTPTLAALRGTCEGAFSFGSGFGGSGLGVLVESGGRVNADGMGIGTAAKPAAAAAALCDARGDDGCCSVRANGSSLGFALDNARAYASAGGARYSSLDEALAACPSGGTVTLLRDCPASTLERGGSLTLDLAGHTLSSLEATQEVELTITSSAAGGRICNTAEGVQAALLCSKKTILTVTGADILSSSTSASTAAVRLSAGGSVQLQGAGIEASSRVGSAAGIELSGAGSVSASGGSIAAYSFAPDATTCAVQATAASVELLDCAVEVQGCTGKVAGIDAGSSARYRGTMSVTTSGAATQAFGIHLAGAGASGAVEGGSISVSSAAGSCAGAYCCLAAGTVSSPAQASWQVAAGAKLSSSNATTYLEKPQAAGSIENSRTGASYSSLAQAAAAAQEGDTLTLRADSREVDAVAIAKALTLDLAGHELTLACGSAAAAGSSGTGAALQVSAAGDVRITSSAGTGALSIELGSANETSSTSQGGLQGIAQAGAGTLTIERCTLDVRYIGSSLSKPQIAVRGIAVSSGALRLESGAKLSVAAAPSQGAYGASECTGISAGGSASVTVAQGCSVAVDANAASLTRGLVSNYQLTTQFSSGTQYLMRVEPDEDSALWQEISEAFTLSAKLDVAAEPDAKVYDAGVYYAAPIYLEDGTAVWAFSRALSADEQGLAASITPSAVYVQASYQLPSSASALSTAAGSSCTVDVGGSLSASAQGDASAVLLQGGGSFTAAGSAALSASAVGSAYRKLCGAVDLGSALGSSAIPAGSFYPTTASAQEVAWAAPSGQALVSSGSARVSSSASVREQGGSATHGAASLADAWGSIDVSFSGACSSAGTLAAPVRRSAAAGTALDGLAAQAGQPSSFTSLLGTRFVFTGWSALHSNGKRYVLSRDELGSFQLGSLLDVDAGQLSLYASYAAVPQGCSLAAFDVCGYSSCTVVGEGVVPSYRMTSATQTMTVPAPLATPAGSTAVFTGWTSAGGASSSFCSAAVANKDASYSAGFDYEASTLSHKWYCWTKASDGLVYQANTRSAKAGASLDEQAAAFAQVGDTLGNEDANYTFLGWAVRSTDREPLYTGALPTVTSATSFYAIYQKSERSINVTFVSEGQYWASAVGLEPSTTVDEAFYASQEETPFDIDADNPFRGWSTEDGSHTPLQGGMTTLGSIAPTDELTLYAVFGYDRALVTFLDSDGTVLGVVASIVGRTIAEQGKAVTVPEDKQADFRRWKTEDGEAFSVTGTVVTEPLTVTAVYKGDADDISGLKPVKPAGDGSGDDDGSGGKLPAGSLDSSAGGAGGLAGPGAGGADERDSEEGDDGTDAASDDEDSTAASASETPAAALTAGDDNATNAQGEVPVSSWLPWVLAAAAVLLLLWRLLALLDLRAQAREPQGALPEDGREIRF